MFAGVCLGASLWVRHVRRSRKHIHWAQIDNAAMAWVNGLGDGLKCFTGLVRRCPSRLYSLLLQGLNFSDLQKRFLSSHVSSHKNVSPIERTFKYLVLND